MAAQWRAVPSRAADVAFLQYTSGSTAAPKGVCVTHGNLLANSAAIRRGFGIRREDCVVSWLPLYHDMGLVGGMLQPIFSGIPGVLIAPQSFLERPSRWLEAMTRYGGTVSGGRISLFACALIASSSDPWRPSTFAGGPWHSAAQSPYGPRRWPASRRRFSAVGFDAKAFYPCYGLAEATLFVSGGSRQSGAQVETVDVEPLRRGHIQRAGNGISLVGCGRAQEGHKITILEAGAAVGSTGPRVGEICVAGPSVARGYWNNEAASAESFVDQDGEVHLRTGDLGFLSNGQLFITGRKKDLIVIRGQNIYPQDLEQAIEAAVPAIRRGRVAVFRIEEKDQEAIGVAAEVSRTTQRANAAELLAHAIRDAVAVQCGEPARVVLLLNPGGLPRTSSGKPQRSACELQWREGLLDVVSAHDWRLGGCATDAPADRHPPGDLTQTEQSVRAIWAEVLGMEVRHRHVSFFSLGGSSLTAVQIAVRVELAFGVPCEARLLFETPVLRDFAAAVDGLLRKGTPRRMSAIRWWGEVRIWRCPTPTTAMVSMAIGAVERCLQHLRGSTAARGAE